MDRVLLFGGSFDPPHMGHMNLLQNAIAAVRPTRVLVVPAGEPPHKRGGDTPGALRLSMCECFRPLFERLEVSDMEIKRSGKSYTCDTLLALQSQNPGCAWYLCIGGDMLKSFTAWYNWRRVLGMVTLVAACRKNDTQPELAAAAQSLAAEGGRVLFAPGPVVAVSSSAIRRAIAAGRPNAYALIPPPAGQIAKQVKLYLAEGRP